MDYDGIYWTREQQTTGFKFFIDLNQILVDYGIDQIGCLVYLKSINLVVRNETVLKECCCRFMKDGQFIKDNFRSSFMKVNVDKACQKMVIVNNMKYIKEYKQTSWISNLTMCLIKKYNTMIQKQYNSSSNNNNNDDSEMN